MSGKTEAPLIIQVMSASVAIANRAGSIIRDIMKAGDLGVVLKNQREDDPQTEADRKAQRCIVSSLQNRFPGITVIGEEDLKETATDLIELGDSEEVLKRSCPDDLKSVVLEDIVVWVDPVDGTKEYTQGYLDHVTVLIGVAVKGESVGGVIHQPYYNYQTPGAPMGRTMYGIVGLGCFGFTHKELPQSERVITTTRSHGTKAVQETIDAMCPTEVLRVGGAGHKVLLCLEGRASAYIFASPGCKKWDTCAPEALLKAAGGKLRMLHGNRYRYDKDIKRQNTGGVIAAYEQHEFYLSKVPQSIKDALPA
ncbi:LOW QUALITY PROTEIN: 3'(2'),5'-bisphosphate nucleotidase 1-like [Diadema antillarum]|uniref:LOW QUALITY PROTEIN: 3'(2'),5'-bisphosphate nucleotidase 1-like n=1 Tax=Diadema antillarum TaxID=105358 RepID=UPI003A8A52A6